MGRDPDLHRRLLWAFVILPAIGGVLAGQAGGFAGAAVAALLLAVAYTRDFLLHAWQRRMGCVCDWRASSDMPYFAAHEACPHHGPLWPHRRPRAPRGFFWKALAIVAGAVGALALLLIELSKVLR